MRLGILAIARAYEISANNVGAYQGKVMSVAIKGGDLIHVGNQILIDRAQTAGPGQVNINRTKIYELGNYYSLGSVTDTPDLTFSLDSFDASAEFEALLLGYQFAVNDTVQTVTVTATGGTFIIRFQSQPTTPIAYNATTSAVQAALLALPNMGATDVAVTGTAGAYTLTFSGDDSALVVADGTALTGTTPSVVVASTGTGTAMTDGTALNIAAYLPMDVVSAFKPGFSSTTPYSVVGTVAIPYLALESLSYKFGITDSASQSATLRGDSIFYNPSSAFIQETAGTNTANQAVVLAHPVVVYNGDTTSGTRYALSASLKSGKRLLLGADYTEATTGGVTTVTVLAAVPTMDKIRVTYASSTPTSYPQLSHAAVTAVRPAAIRGRNIEIYIGGEQISNRWTSVQSVQIDWKVTLDKDEELGNAQVVSQTFDTPDVSGNVGLKPRDYAELYAKVCQLAGVTAGEVAGALTTEPLELLVVLHSPDTGAILKSIYVPDARFTLPGYSGQAGQGQKITVTFNFESDSGELIVYKGAKPGFAP